MKDGLAVGQREAAGVVRLHHPASGPAAHRLAQVGARVQAELAGLRLQVRAVGLIAGHDVVADCDRRHALAHALHHARRLVAEHAGEQPLRVQAWSLASARGYALCKQNGTLAPSSVYASVWQSAVCTIRMRTSFAWGGATTTVQRRRSCGAKATAAWQVIGLPSI